MLSVEYNFQPIEGTDYFLEKIGGVFELFHPDLGPALALFECKTDEELLECVDSWLTK